MANTSNRKVLLALAALSATLAAACSTIAGAGQDIEDAGGAITEAADDTKDEMND